MEFQEADFSASFFFEEVMLEITKKDTEELKSFIENHNFFYIIGHKEPDGDCISSCLAMADILDNFSKPYQLLSAGPFKRNEIIKYQNKFSNEMKFLDENERGKAGLFILDCSEFFRLGDISGEINDLDTFIIDHHKTGELSENAKGCIISDAPACSFLVQQFYEKLLGDIPKKIAEILFLGLCTDTGFFRFLSTNSASVFHSAARLVSYGADPRITYKTINSGKPYSTRKLIGLLLEKTERYLDGKLAITVETLENTKMYGLEGRDSDSLYQLLLSVKGIEVVVFLRQETISTCTAGFRSQDKIDVSTVASKFGGGGHKNASGLCCEGRVEQLLPKIIEEFAKIM